MCRGQGAGSRGQGRGCTGPGDALIGGGTPSRMSNLKTVNITLKCLCPMSPYICIGGKYLLLNFCPSVSLSFP